MNTRGQIIKLGTKIMVNNVVMNYKIRCNGFWQYAATMEEAQKISETAKRCW